MRRQFTEFESFERSKGKNHLSRLRPCCLADFIPVGRREKPARSYCARCELGGCPNCVPRMRLEEWRLDPTASFLGRPRGPRMPCGWNCGAKLTASEVRKHFAGCRLRPTVQDTPRQLPAKPNRGGRPAGPRMPCGWQCGASVTATEMRRHFAECLHRPKSLRQRKGRRAAS
jgi:hypothetical protein